MASLSIRANGVEIGRAQVSAKAQLLATEYTGPLGQLLSTELQEWIAYQQELIASPAWHPEEKRLAASQRELLEMVVTVTDDTRY